MTPRAGRALELSARRALSIGMSVALAVLPTLICIQEARAFQTASSSDAIVIGVVVLSELPAGQETSGSAVTDPAKYQEVPGLVVVLAEMPKPQQPATAGPAVATLEGAVVDVGDGRKQPANQPLTWVPPLGNAFATLSVLLREMRKRLRMQASLPPSKPVRSVRPLLGQQSLPLFG